MLIPLHNVMFMSMLCLFYPSLDMLVGKFHDRRAGVRVNLHAFEISPSGLGMAE